VLPLGIQTKKKYNKIQEIKNNADLTAAIFGRDENDQKKMRRMTKKSSPITQRLLRLHIKPGS